MLQVSHYEANPKMEPKAFTSTSKIEAVDVGNFGEEPKAVAEAGTESAINPSVFANGKIDFVDLARHSLPPFYVYDELDWMSLRCNNCTKNVFEGSNYQTYKHSDDFWFLKSALNHPLRTKDPEKAQLFVVPALMNAVVEGMWLNGTCCIGGECNDKLFALTERTLNNSYWFKRKGGRDHVAVCSHFDCQRKVPKKRFPMIHKCNRITFETNNMSEGRCQIAKSYIGRPCADQAKRTNYVFVGSMHEEKRAFQSRRDVCSWLNETVEQDQGVSFQTCGPGEQCPAVAIARFGFHIRGDTFGSNRLIDLMLSGTVPVFTAERQYEILPPYIPWRNLSRLADASNREEFAASLKRIGRMHDDEYDRLHEEVLKWRPYVDWETGLPFEQYMKLFQQCRKK